MSKYAGFIVGAALIAVAFVLLPAGVALTAAAARTSLLLVIQGAAMILSQALVDLTGPKVPARAAAELSIQLGEQPRSMQIGETATAGSLVDGFNYGGKYGTDWEYLVIRLADHKCASLTGFYVNDEYNAYTGDGPQSRYKDQLVIYFRSDTTNQALPSVVTTNGPGWTSADIGESGCDVIIGYKADKPDAKHPVWPGGRPRFLFVIKGALCYDPRLDDTVDGGSGDHRWEDPDTWEWSENAVICWYKFQRGVYANDDVTDQTKLLVGRGLSAEESPPEYIFAAANLCDEIAAAVYPYVIRQDAGGGLGGGAFNSDGTYFYQPGATSIWIWGTVGQALVAHRDLGISINEDIGVAPDGLYFRAGPIFSTDSELWKFDLFANSGTLLVHGFNAAFAGCRYVAGSLFFYPITNNEQNIGLYASDEVTSTDIGFAASHFFYGPGGNSWAIGSESVSGDDLYLAQVLPGVGTPSATITTTSGAGSAFAMVNGSGNIVAWQDGIIYLIDPEALTVIDSSTVGGGSDDVKIAFDNVAPGAGTIWVGTKQYDTSTLALLRTITLADWVAQTLTASVYDRINNALISHEFGTEELTWRFLDRNGGYRVSGPIYASQQFLEVEEMFAAATAGNTITREGSVQLEPGQAKSVVVTFTDSDILSASEVSWNQGFLSDSDAEWVNTVVARYVEPDQKWNDHAAPVLRDTDDIIADGSPREASITLRLVRYQPQALRVGEINRRLGRVWGRASVKLGPRFCELEEGDWISWQSDRYFGGASKTFRIDAYAIDQKWQNSLTLREITGAVYADDYDFPQDQSQVPPPVFPPDVGSPEADNWALAAVTLDSPGASVPALEITGSADDDDYVESIIIEYWLSDGVTDPTVNPDAIPWTSAGPYLASTTKVDITSIVGGATYYSAVSYVVSGETGDRLVLGPVTVSDFSTTQLLEEDGTTPFLLEDGLTPLYQE